MQISLCGDVMMGRGIDQILPSPCDPRLYEPHVASAESYVDLAEMVNGPIPRRVGFSYVWGAALDEWRRAQPDVRIVNLETSITRSARYEPKGINYRMSPENAGCLAAASLDCCVLANNHVLDWCEAGLVDTLAVLHAYQIKTAGAGRTTAEATAPAVIDIPGKGRVIVLALCSTSSGVPPSWAAGEAKPGVNLVPHLSRAAARKIGEQLRETRKPGDVAVVSIHWGPNWGHKIPSEHRKFAHALIDEADVSIVHGHSSHHAKAMEVYRQRLVLYGCGDFVSDYEGIRGYEEFRDDLAVMYLVDVDPASADLVALEPVPFQLKRFQLTRPSGVDAEWLRDTIDRESSRFGTGIAGSSDTGLRAYW